MEELRIVTNLSFVHTISDSFSHRHDINNNSLSFTLFRYKGEEKNENIRNYRKRIDRNYITMCTIFESVCNSQSSKAFELATAYLQVKKGMANNTTDPLEKSLSRGKHKWFPLTLSPG